MFCWIRRAKICAGVEGWHISDSSGTECTQKTVGNQLFLPGVCLASAAALGTRHNRELRVQWEAQQQTPTQGANTLLKSTFLPLLFAVKSCKTLQSWRFVFLLPNQDHIVPDAFKQRKRACLTQRTCYKVSWITLRCCYSLSKQMIYSCCTQG